MVIAQQEVERFHMQRILTSQSCYVTFQFNRQTVEARNRHKILHQINASMKSYVVTLYNLYSMYPGRIPVWLIK